MLPSFEGFFFVGVFGSGSAPRVDFYAPSTVMALELEPVDGAIMAAMSGAAISSSCPAVGRLNRVASRPVAAPID